MKKNIKTWSSSWSLNPAGQPFHLWLSRGGNWTRDSILEDRELVVFPQVSLQEFKTGLKRIYQGLYAEAGEVFFNQFISGSFQRTVNKAAAEQMPLRIPLVELASPLTAR